MAKVLEAGFSRERAPSPSVAEAGILAGMRFEGVVGPRHSWWILRGLFAGQFSNRFFKSWARATNQRMAAIAKLTSLASWDREQTHRVRQQMRRALLIQVVSDMVGWLLSVLTLGALLIAFLSFLIAGVHSLTGGYSLWAWVSAPLLIGALLAIVGFLAGIIVRATPTVAAAIAAELTITVSYIAVVRFVASGQRPLGPVALPLFIACGTYAVVAAANAFNFLVVMILRRYRNTKYPLETLLYWLIDTLNVIEQPPRRSVGSTFRNMILQKIEDIALLIERDLPRSYRASNATDQGTSEWYKSECRRQATAIRDLKRDILMPSEESVGVIASRLARAAVVVGRGELDLLEKSETQVAVPSRLTRSMRILASVVIGLVPVAAVVLLQISPLAVQGPIGQGLVASAVILAIANQLVLDPRYRDKLDVFKSLWPGSPKSGA